MFKLFKSKNASPEDDDTFKVEKNYAISRAQANRICKLIYVKFEDVMIENDAGNVILSGKQLKELESRRPSITKLKEMKELANTIASESMPIDLTNTTITTATNETEDSKNQSEAEELCDFQLPRYLKKRKFSNSPDSSPPGKLQSQNTKSSVNKKSQAIYNRNTGRFDILRFTETDQSNLTVQQQNPRVEEKDYHPLSYIVLRIKTN